MSNLLENSQNYSDSTGSFWLYFKDEATSVNNDIGNTDGFKSFQYKAILLSNTVTQLAPNQDNATPNNATIAVPSKYLLFGDQLERH